MDNFSEGYASQYSLEEFGLYQTTRAFRRKVYQLIRQLPKVETYCLGVQMRKAAVSVSNNIAEGHGRWHFRDNSRFCYISRGSTEELSDDFLLCLDENYGDRDLVESLRSDAYKVLARINSYIAYLRSKQPGRDKY